MLEGKAIHSNNLLTIWAGKHCSHMHINPYNLFKTQTNCYKISLFQNVVFKLDERQFWWALSIPSTIRISNHCLLHHVACHLLANCPLTFPLIPSSFMTSSTSWNFFHLKYWLISHDMKGWEYLINPNKFSIAFCCINESDLRKQQAIWKIIWVDYVLTRSYNPSNDIFLYFTPRFLPGWHHPLPNLHRWGYEQTRWSTFSDTLQLGSLHHLLQSQ